MNDQNLIAEVRSVMESIGNVAGQGAVYHSPDASLPSVNDEVCAFCSYCLRHKDVSPYCRYACQSAAMQTLTSGEAHFQRCWAGLLSVSVAIAPAGEYRGGISLGGFLAEGEDAGIRELVSQRLAAIPRVDNAPFLARLGSLREIAPSALRGLGHFLLEATFSSGLNSSSRFRKQHDTYVRQRQIAEAYEDLRQAEVVAPDIMSDTYQLASFLNRRDSEGAQEFISRYLAKLLLVSNWNLTKLRAHVRTLAAVVTSQDVLDGVVWEDAMRREWLFMTRIERAPDAESICTSVAEFVLRHFGRAGSTGAGDRTLSDRVTEWLEQHCQEGATLKDASRAVGVSISTISHQLPLDIGKTFTELRAEIRIALAKRLLATSEMPISAIADACGFSDQSHFTKALKTAISLTPGQFRRMLYSFETESKTLG